MESDFQIPACLFEPIPDIFNKCKCGSDPDIGIIFGKEFPVPNYYATCPNCNHFVCDAPDQFSGNFDFAHLAFLWNNYDLFFKGEKYERLPEFSD